MGLGLAVDPADAVALLSKVKSVGRAVETVQTVCSSVKAIAITGIYSVYRSVVNGNVEYIGRTMRLAGRIAEHGRIGRIVEENEGLTGLSYDQAKGVEEALVRYYKMKKRWRYPE